MNRPAEIVAPPGRSLWSDAWRVLRRNRAAMTALLLLATMTLLVIVGP